MAESRRNGGGSKSTPSVHSADAGSELSTHESGDGHGGAPGPKDVGVLKKGDTLGRYLVLEQLGAGAMGVVYAAYDPELDRKIAIKILRPHEGKGDPARRQERLVREAKAMAKLSHPNVGAIYDVGVHGDQVFLAMEFLSGGTLRDWIDAKKRPWREIVEMFIEVGKGLAGAHAEGLIHRDFKPDNVLLDKNGAPKVVDFGLVRLTSAALDRSTTGSMDAAFDEAEAAEAVALPVARTALAALTRTGALTGTPAYMASEQFLGKAIDERTDQFAFCVALYEALHGERPFAGDTVIAIADSVTSEKIRIAPKNSDIPTWVRRCLLRGLRTDSAQRYPGFDELLDALANDPAARLRRRVGVAAASVTLLAGGIALWQVTVSNHQKIEKQAAEHVNAANTFLGDAAAKRIAAKGLRERAFAAFDGFERDKGEGLWAESLSAAGSADAGYLHGIQRLEAAVALTPRRDLKERIADALVDFIGMDDRTAGERQASLRRLAPYDEGGARLRRLTAPASLKLQTTPPGLAARIETYDPTTHRLAEGARSGGRTPLDLKLEPGSYRVTFDETATHVGFHYPVLLAAGEELAVSIPVPSRAAVPKDFVYVPAGRFLFGSDDEEIRAIFLETIPLHTVTTGAFLIARYETTIGDWIAFLDQLPPAQREVRRPHGRKDAVAGFIDLAKTPAGAWEIRFRATDRVYRAVEGERFRYQDRDRRASLDWSRLPVSGISPKTRSTTPPG